MTKPGSPYWQGADVDAESAGMAEGWGPGGTLGHGSVEAAEVLEELMGGDAFDDGQGGVRSRPGYGNLLGAQKSVAARRERAARRASMLVVERLIDEMPDLRDKILDSFGEDGLRGRIRSQIVKRLLPGADEVISPSMSDEVRPPMSVVAALAERIKGDSITLLALVYRRAYEHELRRAQAAVRLGAFEADDWAANRATAAVAAPERLVADLAGRVRTAVDRAKRIIHDMTAPTPEAPPPPAEPESPPEEP